MKSKITIILILTLLLLGCTTKQKLISSYTTLHAIDYYTTSEILKNGGKEVGPAAKAWIDEFGVDSLPLYFVASEAFVIGLGEGVEYLWGDDVCEIYWWITNGFNIIGVGNNISVLYQIDY